MRRTQEVRPIDAGYSAAAPQLQQLFPERSLADSGSDQRIALGCTDLGQLRFISRDIVLGAEIMNESKSEFARPLRVFNESREQNLAVVAKRRVVNVAVEEVDFFACLRGPRDTPIGPVALLTFPMKVVAVD